MTRITIKMILTLGVLSVLVVGISGCTSQTSTTSAQQSQVLAYANAFGSGMVNDTAPYTTTTCNVVPNGTNCAQLTVTTVNTTDNTTSTYALNIQQFSATAEASAFYNNMTFGYNPTTSGPGIYDQVMGHPSTINRAATQVASLTLTGSSANLVRQQDEFVMWGTITEAPTI